ncbi:MAG: putative DNA binding domain-containing protein [Bacteroidales bacterium]
MSRHIQTLIREGEHQQLDFKHSVNDARKIARSLAAFANTDGGTLLIGVRDNGTIAGVASDEEIYMIESAAHLFCKPALPFEAIPWNMGGKTVVEVKVHKSVNVLYSAPTKEGSYKVYVRVDDNNFLANRVFLKVWQQRHRNKGVTVHYREPEQFLLQYLSAHKSITLSAFSRLAKISRWKAEKVLVNLIILGLVQIRFEENQTSYELSEDMEDQTLL